MAFTKVQGVFLKTTPQNEDHRIANLYSSGITDNASSTKLTLTNEINALANVNITGSITIGSGGFTNPVLNGAVSGTAFLDDDTFGAVSATTIASSESIKAYVDNIVTAQDLDFEGDTGGVLNVDLDTEKFTIAGGTGIDTVGSTETLTVAIDSTVATSANTLDFFSPTTTIKLRDIITDNTGTGALVFATSPTLVTPILGTPASGSTLTNCVGLPISSGVSGLGTGVATFLVTPSSANFAAAITDETGTGAVVFATSPTLVTPILGTPASGSTLTNCDGLPISSGVSGLGTGVATFLATPSSANFAAAITDETGTGAVVLGTSPEITTSITTSSASFDLVNTTATTVNFAGGATANVNIGGTGATVRTPGDIFRIDDAAGQIQIDSIKVVGIQQAAVADAAGGATIDAEARTALNDLLAKLRTHGLIAT
jgi:hypothetical protein